MQHAPSNAAHRASSPLPSPPLPSPTLPPPPLPFPPLISGSLRLMKADPALPEPPRPGAPPAAQAGAAPPELPGAVAEPPQAPLDVLAAASAPGCLSAAGPPWDLGPPLGPSPGGPLFAPIRDATAIADSIPPPAPSALRGRGPQPGPGAVPPPSATPMPPSGAHRSATSAGGSRRPPPLPHYSPAAHRPAPLYSPHPQPAHPAHARSPYEGHAVVHRATQRAAEASRLIAPARLPTAKDDLYLRMAAFLLSPWHPVGPPRRPNGRPGRERPHRQCGSLGGGGPGSRRGASRLGPLPGIR